MDFSEIVGIFSSYVSPCVSKPAGNWSRREREREERGKSSTGSGWVLEEHDALEKDTLQGVGEGEGDGEVGFRLHFVKKVIDWFLNLKKKKSEEKRKK